MYRVATRTDPQLSDVGPAATCQPPIGRYHRVPVQVHQPDPHAPQVARRLIALIATRWPATPAEHVGSSAVPGLPGRGIVDLLLPTNPPTSPASPGPCSDLASSASSPRPSRPPGQCCGVSLRHGSTDYRVHVHLVPSSSPRGYRCVPQRLEPAAPGYRDVGTELKP